jgi:hypothetical protein
MAAPMTWGAGAAEWDTSLLACCDNIGICVSYDYHAKD